MMPSSASTERGGASGSPPLPVLSSRDSTRPAVHDGGDALLMHPSSSEQQQAQTQQQILLSEHMRIMLEMQYEQHEYASLEPDQHAASSGILPPPLCNSGSDDPATSTVDDKGRRGRRSKQNSNASTTSLADDDDRWPTALSSFSPPTDTMTGPSSTTKTPFNSVRDVGEEELGEADNDADDVDDYDDLNSSNDMSSILSNNADAGAAAAWLREVSRRHHLSAALSSNTPVSSGSPMTMTTEGNDVDPTVGHGTLLVNPRRLLQNQRHDSGLPRSPVPPNVLPFPSSETTSSPPPPLVNEIPPRCELSPIEGPGRVDDDDMVVDDELDLALDLDLASTPKQTNLSGFSPLSDGGPASMDMRDSAAAAAVPAITTSRTGLPLTKSMGRHMNLASYGAMLGNGSDIGGGGIAGTLSASSSGEPLTSVLGTEASTLATAHSSSIDHDSSSLYLYDDKSLEPQEYLLLRNNHPQQYQQQLDDNDGGGFVGDAHNYPPPFEHPTDGAAPSSYQHAADIPPNDADLPYGPPREASWASFPPPTHRTAPPDLRGPPHTSRRRTAFGRRRGGCCGCCGAGVCCRACCGCVTYWMGSVLRYLAGAESIHRSFCYGAIDGILTGSGIVATFCGLRLVDGHSELPVRQLLVVFSLCACLSDSVGMAIGHVWTTHVAAAAQARDRSAARAHFQSSKHTAKGQLVDMLLGRGMLKIDAMSLADTLEGYPDLFVGALAGESLVGDSPAPSPTNRPPSAAAYPAVVPSPTNRPPSAATYPTAADFDPFFESANPASWAAASPTRYHYHTAYRHPAPPPPPPPPPPPHAVVSYGRLSDYDMDPDAYGVFVATRESRLESICMMVSFTVFAVLPAVILNQAWSWSDSDRSSSAAGHPPRSLTVSSIGTGDTAISEHPDTYSGMNSFGGSGSSMRSHLSTDSAVSPIVSPLSLAMTIGACVMWCLGVWKSRFLDRTYWIWFGIETVVVFGLCILTAYGLGALLRSVLLKDAMYVITTSSDKSHNDDFW